MKQTQRERDEAMAAENKTSSDNIRTEEMNASNRVLSTNVYSLQSLQTTVANIKESDSMRMG